MLKKDLVADRHSGLPGRPQKIIDVTWLSAASSAERNITLKKIAGILNIHRNTLRNYLKRRGLQRRYSTMSDDDLDTLICLFKVQKPTSGLRYAMAFLQRYQLRIQKYHVRLSLQRVDGLRQALHRHTRIERQRYFVPQSNYLWHLDGHHKLIAWGIVIHGIIDGYCRTVRIQTHCFFYTI